MAPTPPPWVIMWNHRVNGKLHFNLRAAMRCGQNLEAKAVASTQYSEIPTQIADDAPPAPPREAKGKADSQPLDFQRSFV
jgi:hypothetical protein